MEQNTKKEIGERFKRLFKDCKLYCIHLNGFSHSIFYKDKQGDKHIEIMSNYLSSCESEDEHLCSDGVYRASNSDRAKALFLGYANYTYQNNAKEIVYIDNQNW